MHFGCNPTDSEVRWWLESQYGAYSYGRSLLHVGNNFMMENSRLGNWNLMEDNSAVWADQKC